MARVMNELNTDPARVYAAGSRKEAIADALMRDGAPQLCFGSITRWVWLDNERRKRRGQSLEHAAGVKVRCAHIADSRRRRPAAAAAALAMVETKSPL